MLKVDGDYENYYQLSVNTRKKNSIGFWAIDSVRQCYEKGMKIFNQQ